MQFKKKAQKGFTLLEVMVVVVIAVIVTAFAVPSYKKSQARAKYMGASGILLELANATKMMKESYPSVNVVSQAFSANDSSAPSTPSSNPIAWMQGEKLLGQVYFKDGTYNGYSFAFSTQGTANCGSDCATANAVACMSSSSQTIMAYKCAWVSLSDGMLHNNEG